MAKRDIKKIKDYKDRENYCNIIKIKIINF
jgi:hypothetical protein